MAVIGKKLSKTMKVLIKRNISFFYKVKSLLFSNAQYSNLKFPRIFYKSSYLLIGKLNSIKTFGSVERSIIEITGSGNVIISNNKSINNSSISINGENNHIYIDEDVCLVNSRIILRGDNCKINIGKASTFAGVRMVNVGHHNDIIIGKNCLFADNIEIWASDTHSIFDSNGDKLNQERSIIICDNVWIGSHVKILKGVNIGSGAVIGMNTLVTKNIAPKTLNVGNPVRCIKKDISWSI